MLLYVEKGSVSPRPSYQMFFMKKLKNGCQRKTGVEVAAAADLDVVRHRVVLETWA
jgi:hypothetical protein